MSETLDEAIHALDEAIQTALMETRRERHAKLYKELEKSLPAGLTMRHVLDPDSIHPDDGDTQYARHTWMMKARNRSKAVDQLRRLAQDTRGTSFHYHAAEQGRMKSAGKLKPLSKVSSAEKEQRLRTATAYKAHRAARGKKTRGSAEKERAGCPPGEKMVFGSCRKLKEAIEQFRALDEGSGSWKKLWGKAKADVKATGGKGPASKSTLRRMDAKQDRAAGRPNPFQPKSAAQKAHAAKRGVKTKLSPGEKMVFGKVVKVEDDEAVLAAIHEGVEKWKRRQGSKKTTDQQWAEAQRRKNIAIASGEDRKRTPGCPPGQKKVFGKCAKVHEAVDRVAALLEKYGEIEEGSQSYRRLRAREKRDRQSMGVVTPQTHARMREKQERRIPRMRRHFQATAGTQY